MSTGWQLVFGLLLIAVGVAWILKREIPIGIEGKPPAFHARGIVAVTLGIAAILIGLVVAFDVPRHLQVDSCLDGGGSFDYDKNVCDFPVNHPIRTQ